VRFTNRTDFPTAMHWHGVRLDNRFDGVPHVTQEPVAPGASFDYRVHFRDAGIYWYHPHHREDVLQDLGLYGNLLVRSHDPNFFAPANRESAHARRSAANEGTMVVRPRSPTHALMGRFGNVLLVNGEPRWATRVRRGGSYGCSHQRLDTRLQRIVQPVTRIACCVGPEPIRT
jgi:FtsP/CotA-like multicopper oxidase with cupredoxin domain